MKTIAEIINLFPDTHNDDWKQTERAWIYKDAKIATSCKMLGGVFHGGVFRGGVFHGGVFHGGVFHDGVFRGGDFHGGVFHGGVFHGGVFRGGVFRGGVFRGGVFHYGDFHGGVFHGGVFHGGVFHGGVFREGWLPVQIQGSNHHVNCPDGKNIQIGCFCKSPEEWQEERLEIAESERYSPAQVSEYKEYIDLVSRLIERNKNPKEEDMKLTIIYKDIHNQGLLLKNQGEFTAATTRRVTVNLPDEIAEKLKPKVVGNEFASSTDHYIYENLVSIFLEG